MRVAFPNIDFSDEDTLGKSILRIYTATGQTFIPNREVRQEWIYAIEAEAELRKRHILAK